MLDKLRETLTSRKFWAMVAGAIPLVLAQDWTTLAQLLMAYIVGQAAVDVAGKLKAPEVTTELGGGATVSTTITPAFAKAIEKSLADLAHQRRSSS